MTFVCEASETISKLQGPSQPSLGTHCRYLDICRTFSLPGSVQSPDTSRPGSLISGSSLQSWENQAQGTQPERYRRVGGPEEGKRVWMTSEL